MTPPRSRAGADASFPRAQRLTTKREFDRVLRRPELSITEGPLRLRATENRMGTPRLGIVCGKRVLRRAVDRNRAKRIIRNSFRLAKSGLPPVDVIVQVRRGPTDAIATAMKMLWVELGNRKRAAKNH